MVCRDMLAVRCMLRAYEGNNDLEGWASRKRPNASLQVQMNPVLRDRYVFVYMKALVSCAKLSRGTCMRVFVLGGRQLAATNQTVKVASAKGRTGAPIIPPVYQPESAPF